jgi:hypothetical protein
MRNLRNLIEQSKTKKTNREKAVKLHIHTKGVGASTKSWQEGKD